MGREVDLVLNGMEGFSDEMSGWITGLPEVDYGRSREMADALDILELTGSSMGIKFVDLKEYTDLNLSGSTHLKASMGSGGGVFINVYKTIKTDPDNIYIAISSDIDESTLVHQLAHILDYFGGSKLMPGTMDPLAFELGVPIDHLEHTEEFGYWLEYLKERFDVELDADDAIIWYLYKKGVLIKGKEVQAKNNFLLKSGSNSIIKYLNENSEEIDNLIRDLPGYIGPREAKD